MDPSIDGQCVHDRHIYDGRFYEGVLNVPDDLEVMRHVIGKKGYYFHMTTERNHLDFLWYNRSDHTIVLFAGEKEDILRAMNILRHRIRKIVKIRRETSTV